MASPLLAKKYLFGFVVIVPTLFLLLIRNALQSSPILGISLKLLLGALLILFFFVIMQTGLNKEKTSYRSMVMERPLFNPRGSDAKLKLLYPLHPQFIALYFDHDDESPYNAQVFSIQALRYEFGYYSDSLCLPLNNASETAQGKLLSTEEALKHLKSYIRDFPLLVHEKDFAHIWLKEQVNSFLLSDAMDSAEIARMIYPTLTDYSIEGINDWLRFEVDESDPVYGAKISAAVYLDYLRLHNYSTTLTHSPLGQKTELRSVYPEAVIPRQAMPGRAYPSGAGMAGSSAVAEGSAQATPGVKVRYIGPFTPIDEKGFAIVERERPGAKDGK